MVRFPSKSLGLALFVAFAALAGVSVAYMVFRTMSPLGGMDFHSYWYAGHFIRQGVDPYTAFVSNMYPRLPVAYLDGPIVTEGPVAQPGLARVPVNTPLMVELLSIFSFLSWPTAKIIWMICNFVVVLTIPVLTLRLFPKLQSLPLINKLVFVLVFLSLFGTRNTVGNGQTSGLVFAMMLLALSTEKAWLGGLALGIALSKYSLSLPSLILLALERKYYPIVWGIFLQILGLLFLVMISNESLVSTLNNYFVIARTHVDLPGIHLVGVFPQLGWIIGFVVSIGVLAAIGWYSYRAKQPIYLILQAQPLNRLTLFNILMIWTLLIGYHRAYDTIVMITFVALVAEWLLMHNTRLKICQAIVMTTATGILLVLILPARGLELPPFQIPVLSTTAWLRWHSISVTISLLIALIISIWILLSTEKSEQ